MTSPAFAKSGFPLSSMEDNGSAIAGNRGRCADAHGLQYVKIRPTVAREDVPVQCAPHQGRKIHAS
jgi:hypothetical protein